MPLIPYFLNEDLVPVPGQNPWIYIYICLSTPYFTVRKSFEPLEGNKINVPRIHLSDLQRDGIWRQLGNLDGSKTLHKDLKRGEDRDRGKG